MPKLFDLKYNMDAFTTRIISTLIWFKAYSHTVTIKNVRLPYLYKYTFYQNLTSFIILIYEIVDSLSLLFSS